jgi:TonB family protein
MAQILKQLLWTEPPEKSAERNGGRRLRVVPRRDDQLFKSLEFAESRSNAVFMSVVVHGVLLTVLIALPLFLYDSLNLKRYYPVTLVPPPLQKQVLEVTHWKPIAPPKPKPEARVLPPPKPEIKPVVEPPKPIPVPEPPKVAKVEPKPKLVPENKRDEVLPEPPKPKPVIKTNVFDASTGSSATPTVNLPPKAVQTGGFGDPNGIKGEGRPDKVANIGSLGSFDLPVGPGAGNGTGGAKGVKGIVASAGFGNGTATNNPGDGGNGGRSARPAVQKGGFGDVDASAPAPAARKQAEATPSAVEITFKPRPDYTDEARKLKLEGEVLVRVLFTASGQVRILGVTRGLGHGLDENAVRAAEQIRFKPAAREGSAVDSQATVHIVFQLAY